MYTAEARQHLRQVLLTTAQEDARITGAVVTGSGVAGAEDAWSDIAFAPAGEFRARASTFRLIFERRPRCRRSTIATRGP